LSWIVLADEVLNDIGYYIFKNCQEANTLLAGHNLPLAENF